MRSKSVLLMLYAERHKIAMFKEFQARSHQSEMTEERVRALTYTVTGDALKADTAAAQFVLNDSRKERA